MAADQLVKAALLEFTEQLGFDLCRVANCVAPPHAAEFREWLGEGRAGEMSWLERNMARRTDPQQVLPGARSVIVLALNYWQSDQSGAVTRGGADAMQRERLTRTSAGEGADDELGRDVLEGGSAASARGRIARYAWGDDYHELIEKKLSLLDAWLRTHGGVQRCYVDTGPMLERDFAALAGVGWHGKSTMLIHPRLGTWFFLAEILTTLLFEPDEAARDHCGTCTRCVSACPTQAITGPRQLDARRCISYLTIELKGSIPLEFRPLIGNRIYGCDDCLSACPWNRFAEAASETAFAARDFVHAWVLRDFLALDDEGFRALFRKSPIKRIKRRGFLRNVCVALGNVGTRADLPALERAAQDPEPLIAEHATWAIEQILNVRGFPAAGSEERADYISSSG